MRADEKQLEYLLNYVCDENEVYIRAEAVVWIKNEFLDYWKDIDEKEHCNCLEIISALYLNGGAKSYDAIAKTVNLHVRTLKRYREKFVTKFLEIMQRYSNLFQSKH